MNAETNERAGEIYGYEFWIDNGDGTRSQEFRRKLPERHCADWGVTNLYTTPQPAPVDAAVERKLCAPL
jgi:hypothetical protein